ncbi:inner nuclear membrane protein enriched at telomere/subtelomere region [Yamadazyma tenuis]|uniref:inner nuclear membrane protein enriched at telomere/subtelomere region n=1 Tax=Candida tenuis TaxID=2315449 RepID=UPI00279CE6AC|nr:inner nuclear membrane protein enriched at telomere/subtelomere region [Yamadazyma tenuis]
MDQKTYLEDDFDPKSLKVAQLRGILVEHRVQYPSNAKKSELVNIFLEKVYPQRRQLRDAYWSAVNNPSTSGFIDKQKSSKNSSKKDGKSDNKLKDEESHRKKSKKNKTDSAPQKKKLAKEEESSDVVSSRESTFSEENIFQSPPSGPGPHGKKRKGVTQDVTPSPKKAPVGGLFDNESDEVGFREELLKSFTPRKKVKNSKTVKAETETLQPKVASPKQETSVHSTPSRSIITSHSSISTPKLSSIDQFDSDASTDNENEDPVQVSPKVASPKVESSELTPKVKSPKSPKVKVNSPKSPIVKSSPKMKSPKSASSNTPTKFQLKPSAFTTLEEEAQDFDKVLKKKHDDEIPPFHESASIIKLTPGPKLAPRPRSIDVISESSYVEDEESEDEDQDEDQEEDTQPTPKKSLAPILLYIWLWFLLSLTGFFLFWYREQSFLIGYCGSSIDEPTFYNSQYPIVNSLGQYLDSFKPQCVKCPGHGRCFEYLELACYEDFVVSKPWYYDLVPFLHPSEKKCVPDTKKAEKLEAMINFSLDILRSKNAMVNCGIGNDNEESGLSQDDLYELLLSMKAPYITLEEFNELWERSLVEIEKEPEIITELSHRHVQPIDSHHHQRHEEKTKNQVFRSTSLQNLSLKCQLQSTLVLTLYRNKDSIIGVMVLTIIVIIIKLQYDEHLKQKHKINQIYHDIIHKLQEQRSQPIKYIGANQLRDLMLIETNLKYKLNLWKQVSTKIEKNSNISYRLIEHHGEIIKVWEWVGTVG